MSARIYGCTLLYVNDKKETVSTAASYSTAAGSIAASDSVAGSLAFSGLPYLHAELCEASHNSGYAKKVIMKS